VKVWSSSGLPGEFIAERQNKRNTCLCQSRSTPPSKATSGSESPVTSVYDFLFCARYSKYNLGSSLEKVSVGVMRVVGYLKESSTRNTSSFSPLPKYLKRLYFAIKVMCSLGCWVFFNN